MSKTSEWMSNSVFGLLALAFLFWAGAAAQVFFWALDTQPPIELVRYSATPVRAGGTVLVVADVKRDLARDCSAVYSRRFVDAVGAMHAIESDTSMGAKSINIMDKRSPSKLIFTVPIPKSAAPGMGTIITPLTYTCNPWHYLRPISLSLDMPVEVLPW